MTETPLAAFPVLANRISVVVGGIESDALLCFLERADLRVEQDGNLLAEGPIYSFPAGRGLAHEDGDPRWSIKPFIADANTLVATIIAREPLTTPPVKVIASGPSGVVYVTVPPARLGTGEQVSSRMVSRPFLPEGVSCPACLTLLARDGACGRCNAAHSEDR